MFVRISIITAMNLTMSSCPRSSLKYFQNILIFTGDQVDPLIGFIQPKLAKSDDAELVQRIEQTRYHPSKKLLEHVAAVIRGKPEHVLLDEQLIVYDAVFDAASKGFRDKKKTVVIVRGGPGQASP